MFTEYNKQEEREYLEKAKELALISGYIVREDLLYGSFFNTFDKAWELALEFIEEYPTEYIWGMDNIPEWDETVEKFVRERYVNGKRIN